MVTLEMRPMRSHLSVHNKQCGSLSQCQVKDFEPMRFCCTNSPCV